MRVKTIIAEDFVNFRLPSMVIATPFCDLKCEKECGESVCHNSPLAAAPIIFIDNEKIIQSYLSNEITEAIVFGGLEPFDNFEEIYDFIREFRLVCEDTIVIYSGYELSEIVESVMKLCEFENIIIKFGRFIPNCEPEFDEVLGVQLASPNQFAMGIEEIKETMKRGMNYGKI